MPRLARILAPFLFAFPTHGAWLAVTQTDRETHLWETRINDAGSFESFYVPRGTAEADPVSHLTHCGAIPIREMVTLRETVAQLRRRHNGKVKEGYGKEKFPPKVIYYGGSEEEVWLGEKAQEIATMVEDMTHLDPDMGLALAVSEWTPAQIEEWHLSRDGKFLHAVTQKAADGAASKVISSKGGVVCREELRTMRKWMLEANPVLKLAGCGVQKTPHFFQFDITYKTKQTSIKCDGTGDKLSPALAGAWQQIKLTPYRSTLETK